MLKNKNKLILFDFLKYYEDVKNEVNRFNFKDYQLQKFLQENKIFVGSFSKRSEKEFKKSKFNRFIRIYRCPTNANAAHAILRHVRNAVAHGRIQYARTNILKLEDYNSKNKIITMKATISQDILISLIEEIKKTYVEV